MTLRRRLAFRWHAFRNGYGRGVTLQDAHGLVRVHDGLRQMYVPNTRAADRFRGGIGVRLDEVAARYVGGTGYVPRQGDVVVDIGAGIGEFTLWCADAGARLVAFEPEPVAFACLERSTASLADVCIFPYALWKERARLRLHGSADPTRSTLIEDGAAKGGVADVEAWTLDALPVIVGLPVIDFMKVAGEGVEPEILAGGIRTLRRTRVLAVDVSSTHRRNNLRERVGTILDALNFRPLAHEATDTILALNTAMVGPFSNRVESRPDS